MSRLTAIRRSIAPWVAASVIVALVASAACADERDERFLDALRERRLFELAEKYSRDKLASAKLPVAEQAEMTVELVRTLATRALHSPVDERGARWQAARQAANDFFAQSPPNPRAILVRVQGAFTLLAQGELARQENDVDLLTPESREAALVALRECSAQLEAIDKELTREVPLRRRTEPAAGELSADELFSLHQHIRQQFARALRNRALLYPPKSDDRVSLLLEATQLLEGLLQELPTDDPLRARTMLDLAVCERMLGRLAMARERLDSLDRATLSPALHAEALAEELRLELAAGRLSAAEDLAGAAVSAGHRSAELDLARLEVELASLQAIEAGPKRDVEKQAIEKRVVALAEQITHEHGVYWGRRADQLVAKGLPNSRDAAGAALLGRVADSLYLKGEFDQAIATYDQAAEQANASADAKSAFELRYKGALVEQHRKRFSEAARRLRELALTLRTHDQAAKAHLLAAWNAAQGARDDAKRLELYEAILEEHASVWPRSATVDQANVWLGQLRQSQGRPREAFAAYRQVPVDSPQFPAAVAGAAASISHALANAGEDKTADERLRSDAIEFFTKGAALDAADDAPLSDTQRQAVLSAAELLLGSSEPQSSRASEAEKLLRAALAQSASAPDDWRSAATARLIVAIASQPGKQQQAEELLEQAGAAAPAELVTMTAALGEVMQRAPANERGVTAALVLKGAAMLERAGSGLDCATQTLVSRLQAEALAAAGRRKEAIDLYARLAKENPDSAEVLEGYASMLLASDDDTSLARSLDEWRRIAARTKPRTDRWYRAKYSVALAQFKRGDRAEAATLLRYMLETPPGMQGSGFEEQYRELLKRCE